MNQPYMEAVFTLLPCMIGENRWEQLGKESQGNFDAMVTRSDEALLMWAMDCYWNVVAINKAIELVSEKRPLNSPMYISEGNSTRKNQGWTEDGKKKYNKYMKMVGENRKDKYWYGVVWQNNFHSRWVSCYRRGKKSSDRNRNETKEQIVSLDDL